MCPPNTTLSSARTLVNVLNRRHPSFQNRMSMLCICADRLCMYYHVVAKPYESFQKQQKIDFEQK